RCRAAFSFCGTLTGWSFNHASAVFPEIVVTIPRVPIRVLLCLAVALHVGPPDVAFAGDGRLDWYTVESDHFFVHFHTGLEEVGPRVAAVAERAHETLAPVMRHTPDEKTHIVV